MDCDTTILESATFLIELRELREQLHQLREQGRSLRDESCALRAEARRTINPWPHPLESVDPLPEAQPACYDDALLDEPTLSRYDQAMEILHTMRAMLDTLPLEWQVAVVKAITARTLLKAHERIRPPTTTTLSA